MAQNSVAGLLTSVDSLFTTQTERENSDREFLIELPLDEISDFPNHPFKVRQDEEMLELVDSVRQFGVLVPGIVRPKVEGGYEMVAGHRRKLASALAGRDTLLCVVRNLTDDEATIIMVDSNLQRERILPSEKAWAYKMKLDAMRRQAGRPSKNNSVPMAQNFAGKASRQILGEQVGESQDQIRRYIRLTNLIPALLDMVDNSVLKESGSLQMALRPAVELSYLPEKEQLILLDEIECEECTPSHAQAIKMRKFSENGDLTEQVIRSILQEEKPNQVEQFKMPKARIAKFFPAGTPAQKMEDTIVKALEMYRKRERQQER